jgi:hypothetical protein
MPTALLALLSALLGYFPSLLTLGEYAVVGEDGARQRPHGHTSRSTELDFYTSGFL